MTMSSSSQFDTDRTRLVPKFECWISPLLLAGLLLMHGDLYSAWMTVFDHTHCRQDTKSGQRRGHLPVTSLQPSSFNNLHAHIYGNGNCHQPLVLSGRAVKSPHEKFSSRWFVIELLIICTPSFHHTLTAQWFRRPRFPQHYVCRSQCSGHERRTMRLRY